MLCFLNFYAFNDINCQKIVKNISLYNKVRGNFRNPVTILGPYIFSLNYPKYSKTFISTLYQCVPQGAEGSKTSQRYAHLSNEVLREASEVMDNIGKTY